MNSSAAGMLRIAIVGSMLVPFDAISNDVARQAAFLRDVPGWHVSVLAGYNARGDVRARVTPRVSDLLLAPEFLQADVIIWHFGIYYPLFDAILVGNGRAKQAVVFHNITPIELVPPEARETIRRSFAQLEHLHSADAIWADSRENAEMLIERGFDAARIAIQPLAVDRPPITNFREKTRAAEIRLVFVGRIVPAKGLQDLVEAMALLQADVPVRLSVVGDLDAAEPAFRQALLERVGALGLSARVEFSGAVSDEERDRMLTAADILVVPSYHEGFCVPVIEALRAGVLPVVYAAHNLRYIADGLCVSCAPGDVPGLAAALSGAVADLAAVRQDPGAATLRLERGAMRPGPFEEAVASHLQQFEPANVAAQLRERVADLISR